MRKLNTINQHSFIIILNKSIEEKYVQDFVCQIFCDNIYSYDRISYI